MPIDSAKAVERSTADDPKQAIAFLKTILEREPNNRDVLKKLASLSREVELFEDSAKYYKLLAISFLEEGNLPNAKKCLTNSLSLNPKDMITWQKLRDCVYQEGKKEEIVSFGRKYVQNFKELGLMEMVREHLEELVKMFPEEQSLRTELADAQFSLGDHKTATQELMAEFYRRLWTLGESKSEALWNAQRLLRDKRDATGKPVYSQRDWAGWVLCGDPE